MFFGDDEDVNGDNKGGDHAHHDGDDDDDDEFERDELSCFRGLVLDISYRLVINPLVLFGFYWNDYFLRSKGISAECGNDVWLLLIIRIWFSVNMVWLLLLVHVVTNCV